MPATPPAITATKRSTAPFDFRSYDDEEYHFDTHGSRALTHISGGEEAAGAVHKTVFDFRFAAWKLAKATGQNRDRCDHLIKVPDGCPQPENIYGYHALRQIFGTEQAARIAAWAAAGYHRKQSRPGRRPRSRIPGPAPAPGHESGTNRRRNYIRMTGRRRTWGSTRRIQRSYPAGSNSSRKDAGPGLWRLGRRL